MKRIKSILLLFILVLVFSVSGLHAQPGNPPGDPDEGGGGPIGGSAPISGGIAILLTLAVAYGGRKIYSLTKKDIAQ